VRDYCTGLFVSPSGTYQLGSTPIKIDTAEGRISIGWESLQVCLCNRCHGILAGFTARDQSWWNMARIGDKKAFCVLEFAQTESFVMMQQRFWTKYHAQPPADKTICDWYMKFQQSGCLCSAKQTGRLRPSAETVERVRETFVRSPQKSKHHVSQELHMPQSSVWCILRKRLQAKGYRLHTLDSLGQWPQPAWFFFAAHRQPLCWNFLYQSQIVLFIGGSVWYFVRSLCCTVTTDSVLANSKTQKAFLSPILTMFHHDCPLAVKPPTTPWHVSRKWT
jgi:hypothetical protein